MIPNRDWTENECEAPDGLLPCKWCGELCADAAWVEDWNGRGKVIRISAGCDQSMKLEKDDTRTEFEPEAEAVAQWNEMMRQK